MTFALSLDLALVESAVGERAAAIGHLRELLEQPSDQVSPALLRLSPLFDPLRGDPAFERWRRTPPGPRFPARHSMGGPA